MLFQYYYEGRHCTGPNIGEPNLDDVEASNDRALLIVQEDNVDNNELTEEDPSSATAPVAPTPVQDLVHPPPQKINVVRITTQLWVWILAVFFNYMVTLSVFPAVTTLVESTDRGSGSPWADKYFNPVGCFLLYNMGDFLGRILASHIQKPTNNTPGGAWIVLVCSLSRVAFLPLFLFCNASPFNRHITEVRQFFFSW